MTIFTKLWQQYTSQNPRALSIYQGFLDQGENIVNDHIAIRTVSDNRVNIDVLSKPFFELGYEAKGNYNFENKKLTAKHFELADPIAPKVFISQLRLDDFSEKLQTILHECISKIPEHILLAEDLVCSGNHWQPLSYAVYQNLLEESEYAAWFYAFGFCANHFTVNINQLKNYSDVTDVNQYLKNTGFELNSSGGEVKGTPADLLEQSSTMAEPIDLDFVEGTQTIPSCYYEFAKRYPDANGNLFQGFVAGSADKIFESTDRK